MIIEMCRSIMVRRWVFAADASKQGTWTSSWFRCVHDQIKKTRPNKKMHFYIRLYLEMQYCILRENWPNKKCNIAFLKIDQIKSAILHSQLQEREPAVQNCPREEEKLRLHLANRWRGGNRAWKIQTNKPHISHPHILRLSCLLQFHLHLANRWRGENRAYC